MEEIITCQWCEKTITKDDFKDIDPEVAQIEKFNPSLWRRICSYKCQQKSLEFNAMWNMKNKLRNISNIPFGTFQKAFNFPEAGNYTLGKYEKMRINPAMFLYGLDIDNFKKFVKYCLV